MIEQLQVQKLWFVAKQVDAEKELDVDNAKMGISLFGDVHEVKGYTSFEDIPREQLEGMMIFQAYQFVYNGKPVTVEKEDDFKQYHLVFFVSEEEAVEFKEDLLLEMEDNYWDDKEERRALIALGYDLDDDDDFSEISINEGRRWNERLEKWYIREFDGLGYKMHYNGKVIEF